MCQEVTSSRCGNNIEQQTLCSLCNSKTAELQQPWTSNPLELSLCEATSSQAKPLPQSVGPCLFPQAISPQTNQCPPSSVYPVLPHAMGIVRPIHKNKGSFDICPPMPTITSEIKTSTNPAPAPICAVTKTLDILPQQQCTSSVTGVKSLQSNISGATCPSAVVIKAGDPNSAPSSCSNILQQSPTYSFQLPQAYSEQTTAPILPTLANCAQKPIHSSPTAATYSVFTELPNLNLCSPHYYLQNTPSTVIADVDPMNKTPVSSLPRSCLQYDTQKPPLLFLVGKDTPTKTTMQSLCSKDQFDIGIKAHSSAIVRPEENYGNIDIINRCNSCNDVDEHALETKSGPVNLQGPINLVINIPEVNVPAPSVTILPTPVPSLPSEPAPIVPQFVPTSTMPIIINNSKSTFKSLLPIILISLLRDGGLCGEGSSCNCGSMSIPIPYPIPIPTNCPIINTGRKGRRKSRKSKINENED